jgi:hypothetical protein
MIDDVDRMLAEAEKALERLLVLGGGAPDADWQRAKACTFYLADRTTLMLRNGLHVGIGPRPYEEFVWMAASMGLGALTALFEARTADGDDIRLKIESAGRLIRAARLRCPPDRRYAPESSVPVDPS